MDLAKEVFTELKSINHVKIDNIRKSLIKYLIVTDVTKKSFSHALIMPNNYTN